MVGGKIPVTRVHLYVYGVESNQRQWHLDWHYQLTGAETLESLKSAYFKQVHLSVGLKQIIHRWKGVQFVTRSFIAMFQTIVFNSGLYNFSSINWKSDGRVTMQNKLIIRVVIKLKSIMLLSGEPKTFPFFQSATLTHL